MVGRPRHSTELYHPVSVPGVSGWVVFAPVPPGLRAGRVWMGRLCPCSARSPCRASWLHGGLRAARFTGLGARVALGFSPRNGNKHMEQARFSAASRAASARAGKAREFRNLTILLRILVRLPCQHSPLPTSHVCRILRSHGNAGNGMQHSGLHQGNRLMRQVSVRFQQRPFPGLSSPHHASIAAITSGPFRPTTRGIGPKDVKTTTIDTHGLNRGGPKVL